ncbi:hypothetical protein MRX96_046289 [Rhipicephalus microplus]
MNMLLLACSRNRSLGEDFLQGNFRRREMYGSFPFSVSEFGLINFRALYGVLHGRVSGGHTKAKPEVGLAPTEAQEKSTDHNAVPVGIATAG